MKILWMSDSPVVPSGFGNVTRAVCEGFVRQGHDVHILGWQNSATMRWNGATLHANGRHPMGADVLLGLLARVRPDFLITLGDVWWLSYVNEPSLRRHFETSTLRWLLYFPIDGHRPDGTLPPSWTALLRLTDAAVAMSRYGQQCAAANGVICDYIPHGVDTTRFSPADDKAEAKRRFGYADRFVILSDARNQPRKLLPRLLTIFARFARDKPDALLHLHCDPRDPTTNAERYSYRIESDVQALGLAAQVRFTRGFTLNGGLALDELAQIYRAADVHLLSSAGEGFGLPTLQAAAAGVVPMASAYSASHELVDGHGVALRVSAYFPDEFGIGRAAIDIDDAVAQLDVLYHDRERLREQAAASRRFALAYDWSRLMPQWEALLRRVSAQPARRCRSDYGAVDIVDLVVRDASIDTGSPRLDVPISRTERLGADPRASERTRGAVYVPAGATASAALLAELRALFPVLHAVDEASLPRAILALDLDGCDQTLPLRAAQLAVPLLGLERTPRQRALWPELTVESPADPTILARARALLTDHAAAVEQTEAARRRALRPDTATGARAEAPRLLVLTPVKDAVRFLDRHLENIMSLDHPRQRLSLAWLDSDSSDGTHDALARRLPALQKELASAQLFKRDYGFRSDVPRWDPGIQLRRRSILARSRNFLLSSALRDHDWVLWLDVDVSEYPVDIIDRLLAPGKEIIVPNCVVERGGRTFDYNTFQLRLEAGDLSRYISDGILQPPKGVGRRYLDELRAHELVPVDAVGGTMLLIKADLHREGLIFPPFSYKLYIETEGLAVMARDMGHDCWGLPNVEIIHPAS